VRTRIARRAASIVTLTVVSVLVTAGPVLASVKPDDGEGHGSSLGLGNTILLFVVIPLGGFLLIATLAVLPSTLSRPRYRPGRPWEHEPRWIGRPVGTSGAVAPTEGGSAEPGSTARGGASAEW
jgi:hypothetical protein